jgi:hypothetical protein
VIRTAFSAAAAQQNPFSLASSTIIFTVINVIAVTASFRYDPAEQYHATRAITRLTPLRWLGPGCLVLFPVSAIGLTLLAAQVAGRHPREPLLGILPYVFLSVFWGILIPVLQRYAARRLPRQDVSVRGVQERRVDATGYHAFGNGISVDIPWHAIRRAVETKAFFFFFYNWQCAYYVPKRPLDAAQIAQLRAIVRAAVGEKADVLQA